MPIGIIGLGLAFWLVPDLPTEKHDFDLIGVVLSGVGMFMVVFALQEGQSHDWAPWVWGTLAGGIGFMAAFVFWQQANRNEPLVPLGIFRDRDFSLSSLGVATIGFVVTAMILPVMFYAQAVCGLSPTRVGAADRADGDRDRRARAVGRQDRRPVSSAADHRVRLLDAGDLVDVAVGRDDADDADLANRVAADGDWCRAWRSSGHRWRRPPRAICRRDVAGAGSGVYNATRQVGSVLGSASMAAFMTTRISAEMPLAADGPGGEGSVTQLPGFLHEPFAAAMSQSLLLPAFVALFGVVAAMFLLGFASPAAPGPPRPDADRRALGRRRRRRRR